MINRTLQVFLFMIVPFCSVSVFGQTGAPTNPVLLSVGGEVATPLKLTATDLAKLPRKTVRAKDHDGKDVSFEGVELGDVLKLAGVKFGEQLRGKDLALYLVAGAKDNYHVVYTLAELDHGFTDRIIIIADRRDGKPLDDKEGPLRIVVPDDKRQARWEKWVTSLTIQRAP